MRKIFLSTFIIALFAVISSGNLSAQDVDGIPVTVAYPTAIPAGTTYDQIFADDNFAACVASSNGAVATDTVTQTELEAITDLSCSSSMIEDINGIEYMSGLTIIDLQSNEIVDVSPLSVFESYGIIESINLDDNEIVDVSTIANLSTVNDLTLTLSSNHISDISAFNNYTSAPAFTLYAGFQTVAVPMNIDGTFTNPVVTGTTNNTSGTLTVIDTQYYNSATNTFTLDQSVSRTTTVSDGEFGVLLVTGPYIEQPGDTTIEYGTSLDVLEGVTGYIRYTDGTTTDVTFESPDGFKGDGTDAPGTYEIVYTASTYVTGSTTSTTELLTTQSIRYVTVLEPTVEPTVTPTTEETHTITDTGISNVIILVASLMSVTVLYVTLRNKIIK